MKYLQVLIYHDEYADDKWLIINKLLYFIIAFFYGNIHASHLSTSFNFISITQ